MKINMLEKVLFCVALAVCACTSFDEKKELPNVEKLKSNEVSNSKNRVYVCPMKCEHKEYKILGSCSVCKMPLIQKVVFIEGKYAKNKEMTVCMYLQDNVELLDFAGPMEVFTASGFNVFTVSKSKQPITSQGALTIIPEFDLTDAPPADVMIFFGGSHGAPSNDPDVIKWIQSRKKQTDYFISVCTGAFIMGRAGILDGQTATCYHLQIDALRKALSKTKVVENVRFVDNGNIISTAGVSAGTDGAFHFVRKIKGEEFAINVAKMIEYDKWNPKDGLLVNK